MTSPECLNITRIVVAHRPQTIEHADVSYIMDKGRLLPMIKEPLNAIDEKKD
ncbi:MAG: hypothetical protein V3U57_01685 [Robiginitomaculum sp.]